MKLDLMMHGACLLLSFLWLILSCTMGEFRIASLNVNGARDVRKRLEIYEVVRQKQIDVLFMQETHSDDKNTVEWLKQWKGSSFFKP